MNLSQRENYSSMAFSNRALPSCSEEHEERICSIIAKYHEIEPVDITDLSKSGWIWASFGIFAPLCLFGILGNILTIIMFARYIKKTTTSIFIIALATMDLLVCAIPMVIWLCTLLGHIVQSDFICKLDIFMKFLAITMSGSILLAIAVDRFFLIFLVKTTFMTTLRAKIIVGVLMVICLAFSVPSLLTHAASHLIPERITGRMCDGVMYCTTICRPIDSYITFETTHHLWLANLILFLIIVVLFILIYSLIFIKVFRMHKKMTGWRSSNQSRGSTTHRPGSVKDIDDDHLTFASGAEQSKIGQGEENTNKEMKVDDSMTTKQGNDDNNVEKENLVLTSGKPRHSAPRRKKKLPHLHTAVTLFLVTASFIVAYVPMTVLILVGACVDADKSTVKCEENTPYNFIWHLFYLNHIVNPIIYSFMNPRFREALKRLCRRRKKDGSS